MAREDFAVTGPKPIGRGAFGTVFAATRIADRKKVALKLVLHSGEWGLERIEAERKGAILQQRFARAHGMVPEVYDFGADGDDFYIAMEFVEGTSLDLLLRGGRLPASEAAAHAAWVCAFLEKAHAFCGVVDGKAYRIVHTDLKPAHLMITPDGDRRVLDFGIAKALEESRELGTDIARTIAYASPERLVSDQVNPHADFWSLGVMLFEMVCGHRPYPHLEGPRFRRELEHAIASNQPRVPLPDACPPELGAIISKMLAFQVEHRYPSAEAIKADLDTFLKGDIPDALHIYETPATTPVHRRSAGAVAVAEPIARISESGDLAIGPSRHRDHPFDQPITRSPDHPIARISESGDLAIGASRHRDHPPDHPITRSPDHPIPPSPPTTPLPAPQVVPPTEPRVAVAPTVAVAATVELSATRAEVDATVLRPAGGTAPEPARRSIRRRVLATAAMLLIFVITVTEGVACIFAERFRDTMGTIDERTVTERRRAYDQVDRAGLLDVGLHIRVHPRLQPMLLAVGDRVIADYRREEPAMGPLEWAQAYASLTWAIELSGARRGLRGKQLTALAHVKRFEAQASKGGSVALRAQESLQLFRRAAEADSESYDPYLGMARLQVYSLNDVDAAAKSIEEAEQRGYVRGRREAALLGDGYLRRAGASWRRARVLTGDQRTRELTGAREDYQRCVDLFDPIVAFGNSAANLEICKAQVERIDRQLHPYPSEM
jgi:serine/threonine protein kinase